MKALPIYIEPSCLWSVEATYLRALAKRDMEHWRAHNKQNERVATNDDIRKRDWSAYYQKRQDKRKAACRPIKEQVA